MIIFSHKYVCFHLNLVLPISSKKPREILIFFFKSSHFTLILLILGSVYLGEFFSYLSWAIFHLRELCSFSLKHKTYFPGQLLLGYDISKKKKIEIKSIQPRESKLRTEDDAQAHKSSSEFEIMI